MAERPDFTMAEMGSTCEEEGGGQRLDDRPQRAEHRLLVADLDVAPHKKIQQLAVAPELRQMYALPRSRRLDSQSPLNRCWH